MSEKKTIYKCETNFHWKSKYMESHNPILDTRISVRPALSCVTLRPPPLDSEMGWTGELSSLNGKTKRITIFFFFLQKKKLQKFKVFFKKKK